MIPFSSLCMIPTLSHIRLDGPQSRNLSAVLGLNVSHGFMLLLYSVGQFCSSLAVFPVLYFFPYLHWRCMCNLFTHPFIFLFCLCEYIA
jgi:hypothetical protein